MSAVWHAVHLSARTVCPTDSLRLTNLVIAAAVKHASTKRRKFAWCGSTAQAEVSTLALSPLELPAATLGHWDRLAELAMEAAHLGLNPEGMHSWAAAYQSASATQKTLGAYATHNSFASALARITMQPLVRGRTYRIVDPSVGAGNLLLAAAELYGRGGTDAELKRFILSLHGVELDPTARELCCLLIWLFGFRSGVRLEQVATNIRQANALTKDWWSKQDLFEVLLMNPPWESLRHKVDDASGNEREATIRRLLESRPGAPGLPPLFSAQGKGDRNLFKAFVELVPHLIAEGGRLGALIPTSFASDAGLTDLRERYLSQFEIARWTSFENRSGYFPIDGRYKFGLLAATRSNLGTRSLSVRSFAVEPDEVDAPHVQLSNEDIQLIGRKYHIIPELSNQRELEILRIALRSGIPLFESGVFGQVMYRREVDLSLDKEMFRHVTSGQLKNLGDATFIDDSGARYVPLLEGRSVGAYDCFQKTWLSGKGRTAVWVDNEEQSLGDCNPQYVIRPRVDSPPRVAICDVTAATNTRTVIATLVPDTWQCGNTAPVLEFENDVFALAGLGILNSMVFDWIARRLTSGLHLNKFILEGFVWPALQPNEIEEIAYAAWSICLSKPRSGISTQGSARAPTFGKPRKRKRPLSAIDAAAAIEISVAKGLGLSRENLLTIYDSDKSDRRGFWRYFAADPAALNVVEKVLSEFSRVGVILVA